jgi:hypothetical protein
MTRPTQFKQLWNGQKRSRLKKGEGPANRRPFSARASWVSREKQAQRGIQGGWLSFRGKKLDGMTSDPRSRTKGALAALLGLNFDGFREIQGATDRIADSDRPPML